jgi:uncharacterized membrane protein
MLILVAGLLVFLGIHSIAILAPQQTARMKERLGTNAWRGIYSLVSLAGLAMIVYGYGAARAELVIYYVPPLRLRYVAVVLLLPVFPLLLAAYLPGRIQSAVKHPMLTATKLWATAHLLANGARADILLFGALLAWAVLDRVSLKTRTLKDVPRAPATPYNDWIVVIAGLALFAAFVLGVHAWLIGVPVPLPWSASL